MITTAETGARLKPGLGLPHPLPFSGTVAGSQIESGAFGTRTGVIWDAAAQPAAPQRQLLNGVLLRE